MYSKLLFPLLLIIGTLSSFVVADPKVFEKDGKVIVHDEAVIPTHTVTQYATVTQTKEHVSTITPTISVHTLAADEPMPVIDDNATLIKKLVVDVTVDSRYANGTKSWFHNGTVHSGSPSTIILSSSVAAAAIVGVVVSNVL